MKNKFTFADTVAFKYRERYYNGKIVGIALIPKTNKYEYTIHVDEFNIDVHNVEEKNIKRDDYEK